VAKKEPVIVRVTRAYKFPPERVFDAWLDADIGREFLFATSEGKMMLVLVFKPPPAAASHSAGVISCTVTPNVQMWPSPSRALGAIAVKLCRRLLYDLRASFAGAFAVRIDILALGELDVHGLRVLAPSDVGLR
jgi:hypothetical protein